MANPFLMTEEDVADISGSTNDLAFNPFLAQEVEGNAEFTDNPFMAGATNPFAGFGDDDSALTTSVVPEVAAPHSSDAAMSFFGTTIEEPEDDMAIPEQKLPNPLTNLDDGTSAYSSEDELVKKKAPPRPIPPSQTTQDLIFAVSDQLDQASSQMLGRLPKTRSPSPVSMRDLHSPSPYPDTVMDDFLDCSDDNVHLSSTVSVFGDDLMADSSDNPFATPSVPVMPAAPVAAVKQPPRPPPPRPVPPRPTPPTSLATAAPEVVNPVQQAPQPQSQEPDLFDMFDSRPAIPPKPPAPKTTQDIMSLFNTPKPQAQPQQAQQDLLSGDILGDILSGDILGDIPDADLSLPPPMGESIIPPMGESIIPPMGESIIPPMGESIIPPSTTASSVPLGMPVDTFSTAPTNDSFVSTTEIFATPSETLASVDPNPIITEPVDTMTSDSVGNTDLETLVEPFEQTQQPEEEQKIIMDSIFPEAGCMRAPTPDIEITTVESLPRSDDEEEPQPELEKDAESGVEMDDAKSTMADDSDLSQASETNITTQAQQGSPPTESNMVEPLMEQEQMDTGLDFAPSIPSGSASANPFASPEMEEFYPSIPAQPVTNIFAVDEPVMQSSPFADTYTAPSPAVPHSATPMPNIFAVDDDLSDSTARADDFDAFAAKFDSVKKEPSLLDGFGGTTPVLADDAWGAAEAFGAVSAAGAGDGFGGDDEFDSFLAMKAPVRPTLSRKDSGDSLNEDKEFNVVIRPKGEATQAHGQILVPPPPPRGSQNNSMYSGDSSPRFNPFDKGDEVSSADCIPAVPEPAAMIRSDSQESPGTPLFDDDVSQPLEDFPRITYTGPGWEMQLRQPNKKKITGQRFWKKVFVRIVFQGDNPVVQLYNLATDKEPFQELPLQPCYSVSEIGAQQYDQFGKIFTLKLQYIFYKERPGVRPGQVTKAERLTNKLSQFAAYAIQGDYQGVKEFGSDLKKLGLPVEHAPQVSQLFKIGSMSYEDLKQFSVSIEEALFKLSAHRDRALNYKSEEVQITAVDEIYVEQDAEGHVDKQIARVRLFFLGFLSGMPSIELGVNDLWRQGKEVVGRHDIIPVVTEEWIRLEGVEFHNTVQPDEYERTRIIKFQPPDACYIELMRFRVRPPKNRELPLQLKAQWCVTGNRVELRADVLVPGFASRKLGQIPCEDVAIRFPIPECWIYLFRVEKHFRYGSVKSAHRRTGKIKGIERILGTVDQLQESLIEVTSGQAKYEHHHRSIVWRCPRLPKEGQGAYTTHQMVCRMALTSYDQVPEQLAPYCYVEFTMPATQVSHTTVRSVSVQDSDSDEPPEKYVRYLARHEYRVGIEATSGDTVNPYLSATKTTTIKEEAPQPPPATSPMAPSDSDSESN